MTLLQIATALATLERRGVITTDPLRAEQCCGLDRDEDGFCRHRPGHPIYVNITGRKSDYEVRA